MKNLDVDFSNKIAAYFIDYCTETPLTLPTPKYIEIEMRGASRKQVKKLTQTTNYGTLIGAFLKPDT